MRRARQRRADDLLDLVETQNKFGELVLLQVIAQGVVVVQGPHRPSVSPGIFVRSGNQPLTDRHGAVAPLKPTAMIPGASRSGRGIQAGQRHGWTALAAISKTA